MERILGAIVFPARLSGSWKSRSGISLVWQTMARRPIKRKDPREEAPPMLKTLTRRARAHLLPFPGGVERAQTGQARRADLPDALSAWLRLMPLDTFVKDPALRVEVADAPNSVPEVQKICQQVIDKWEGRHAFFAGIERHAFYERSRQAFAIRPGSNAPTAASSSRRAW